MVVFDTNIIIDHLRLQGKTDSILMQLIRKNPNESFSISVISIQELYEGISTRDDEKEQYLLVTISPLKILPYTYEIAQLAGEIARDLKNPIELADSAIAATSIINNAKLFTFNKKDFKDIKGLEIV